MCRIAGVTSITDKNRDKVWAFMKLLGEAMTPGNSDGLGYAAFDKSGNIFGERWLINQTAFKDISKMYTKLNVRNMEHHYNFFGERVLRHEAQAMVLHTRAATCGRGIQNTHPFLDDIDNPSVAIIHNGVITNEEKFTRKFSTCDSEVIAHLYKECEVSSSLKNVQSLFKKMSGWYTVLALSKTPSGRMIMDAFTDGPRLTSYYIPELSTRVYSTLAEDIEFVCRKLEYTFKDGKRFKPDSAQRIDVLTGEVLDSQTLESYKPMQVIDMSAMGEVERNIFEWIKNHH